jgi:hypothetical protein
MQRVVIDDSKSTRRPVNLAAEPSCDLASHYTRNVNSTIPWQHVPSFTMLRADKMMTAIHPIRAFLNRLSWEDQLVKQFFQPSTRTRLCRSNVAVMSRFTICKMSTGAVSNKMCSKFMLSFYARRAKLDLKFRMFIDAVVAHLTLSCISLWQRF